MDKIEFEHLMKDIAGAERTIIKYELNMNQQDMIECVFKRINSLLDIAFKYLPNEGEL